MYCVYLVLKFHGLFNLMPSSQQLYIKSNVNKSQDKVWVRKSNGFEVFLKDKTTKTKNNLRQQIT